MTSTTPPTTATKPIQRAAGILWSRSDISQDEARDLATSIFANALDPEFTAPRLWDMDQRIQTAEPRPWSEASQEERWPYLESAAEYRDAVMEVEPAHAL